MKSLIVAFLSCFLIVNVFSQVNLNQGLIGYFPFNGDASDRSGNGNNPTFNNGTLAPDRFGNPNQAYWFDGSTGSMTIPGAAGLNTATAMSIALYFNPESTNLATLVGKINYTGGNGTQFQIAINYNLFPGVLFGVNDPADNCNNQINLNSSYVNTGGSLPVNQWYCLAATFDQGVQKIYLNGTLIQTKTTPFTTLKQCSNSDIQIGTWWQNDQQRYKGRIDDVRIYNRALNQAEVTALCTACSNPTSDFNYQQVACKTNEVQFTPVGNNLADPVWDFGDGTTLTGTMNPVHTYASTGNYTVKLSVQNANCKDEITKTVTVVNMAPCPINCNNWLKTPSQPSYFRVGDLDVPGNKITVEAVINRTTPYVGGLLYAGDVVSKHTGPGDVNYLLRPNDAEITTSNGYFRTPDICEIDLNKTYHVAMVYDGSTLKFYRDGFLMSQVAATGNLYQNNLNTQIGLFDPLNLPTQFVGFINEVRIWNIARTQTEIRTYMNTSLPSPATQTGLLAYYTFDNLLNKQGNSTWNGTLGGSATINNSNPNCSFTPDSCKVVTADFTTPDTVCLNTPVTITNRSKGETSDFWNFCVADINTPPTAVNIGNPGGSLSWPVFMDYTYVNGNYYGFVVNHNPGGLIRLDFGNSLLNTPTSVNLGNLGGVIPAVDAAESIQIVQNEGKWYIIMVAGWSATPYSPRIIKIEFGASITNPSPVATNWGNIGNIDRPIDLHVFKENNNWYGFTVNAENNTITRFNFTNSFNNTPTAINLGNIGGLSYPTGIYAINDNNFWRVFIVNGGDNQRIGTLSSLTRLDFGSSLLNTPTGVNLGNPGGMLHHPRDLTIMKFCGQIIGFAVNGNASYNDIVRLNFNNDLNTVPTLTSLGNIGNLNFPHSISKLFRANDDVYAFITNVASNTITRLRFAGCTNASVSSSTAQNPAPVTYSTPGTYNINLTIDDGLPTQSSFCRQVVVLAPPVHTPTQSYVICAGNSIKIGTGVKNAKYTWNTGATTDSITVNASGTYWVQTDVYGCTNKDSITVTVSSCTPVIAQFTTPDTVCVNTPVTITNNSSSNAVSYYWTFCTGNLNAAPVGANLGVVNSALTSPVYIDYVQDNGKYYGFMTDNYSGRLIRLEFGNSLLNTPVTTNMGDFGGIIPHAAEGIQVVKNEGKWYAIIVGGTVANGTAPSIIKIEFGANIANNTPVATNWGNVGGLAYPHDLYVFPDNNGVWYGLTVNSDDNTITRFNFTNSFSNTPTGTNLGNIGTLSGPTGIYAINDGGNWYAFVTNAVSSTLTRLDFGNSLLNTPTGTNLGNIGGLFHSVWDIQVIKYCGNLLAYVINADQSYNNLLKLDFNNNITSTPTAVNVGNIGNMRFPHCLSKIFRAGSDLYTFVPNVANQTLTRISFAGCNNASIPNSTVANPGPITYNTPGTYNINLTLDEGLPTQTAFCKQVVVLPEPAHTPTQVIDICTGGSIKIGTGVKYAQYTWNTSATTDSIIVNTPGTYWVQTDRYGCSNKDTISVQYTAVADYYFKQDVCNPLAVQFSPVGNNLVNPYWNLGDGNTTTGNLTTSHTYPAYGTYTVKFGVENGTCKDTITKNISINLTQSDLIFTPDTTICFNGTGQLRAKPALSFCWSPTTYLNNPNIPNPITATPGNITYYYTAEVPGNNLVVNGDFSSGNTGFNSSYNYTFQNNTAAEFSVGPNPQAWNPLMGTCTDHTTGNGNMLLVNGAPQPNVVVWIQKINVTPNTNYAFSAWLQNINVNNTSSNPPRLQFSINGKAIGNILQGQNAMCVWDQFYTTWNSGNNTTASIAIINQNTVAAGNDFALDDISFAPVSILYDSVKVMVDTPVVKTINDTTICKNAQVPLQATGGVTWSWSPATGLSNAAISNPIATPLANTQYIVTGTNLYGCSAKDTVQINLFPDLVVNLGPDVTDCAINNLVLDAGNAGSQYLWQDGSVAQTFTANTFGKYYVQVTNANGCVNSDTIILSKTTARLGDFTYKIDACNPLSVQLTGSGSNLQNPYWNFGDGNATAGNFNTSHTYAAYGDYTVQFGVESGYCKDTITHAVSVHVTPANIIATTDTTICFNTNKQLQATPSANFCWSPATYLNNPNIPNPVTASPQTITYYYTAEINGVILRDSVTISVDTPMVKTNNDTVICKDAQVQLQATGATTWSWLPTTGLSNAAIGNPVAAPTVNTDYIVTGINSHGCSAKDTVTIALYPVPAVITTHDILACPQTPVPLSANSTLASWLWSPAATLNNPAIANPIAIPNQNTKYLVKATDAHNCSYTDSVNVQLQIIALAASTAGGTICQGESVLLKATGGDAYLWSPASSLDNATLPGPTATPGISTQYSVYIKENTCNHDTTINVMVAVKPSPIVTAEKSNDLDCVTHTTRLSATGTPGNTYLWYPASGLDHPNSPNPVSTTDTTITYVVAGTKDGCTTLDSITVYVTSTGKVSFEIPNAFTPNNDGLNDCFGVKSWGGAVIEEFAIYNRWGQKVYSSNKENPCWDGRFNGEPQPAGGYVYVIKAKTYCGPIKRTGTLMLVR